jgi:hypothetical protein
MRKILIIILSILSVNVEAIYEWRKVDHFSIPTEKRHKMRVFYEIPRFFQTEGILVEENKVLQESKEETKRDWTWILSLPAGGIGGGWVGVVTCGGVGYGIGFLMNPREEVITEGDMATFVGTMVGWTLGASLGIWLTGRYLEIEKGSFKKTLLGATIGGIIGLPLHWWIVKKWVGMPPSPMNSMAIGGIYPLCILLPYNSFSLVGGIIGFNLSL